MRILSLPAWRAAVVCCALMALSGGAWTGSARAQQSSNAIPVGSADIGGIVTSSHGPEAGVWVIAETTELGTKYAKSVVTDDRGRYLIPELPKADYSVWVRGYGLVDSPKIQAAPGKRLDLKAVTAPDAKSAAEYYPAIYWYAMLTIPDKSLFPGTGAKGNLMPETLKTQGQWLDIVKTDGCVTCHQLGDKATRTIPSALGPFASSAEAWERRIQSGQAMNFMVGSIGRLDTQLAFKLFGDWTDRIAAGELPFVKPQRPQGIERNLVVTVWDWASPTTYLHDAISTDKRNPTRNPNGLIYGSPEDSTDEVPILDPIHNVASTFTMPFRDKDTPSSHTNPMMASAYWGEDAIWDSHTSIHNPMFDGEGRVWFTTRIRAPADPAFCKAGSDQPSAKEFPLEQSGRQLAMYDPKTQKATLIDTCFGTHHLQFASDANETLWTSAGGSGVPGQGAPVIGWLNTKLFLETGDAEKAQGWSSFIVDTNANGKRDAAVEPKDLVDPSKDKRVLAGLYGVSVSPVDGTIWGSALGQPGYVVHFVPGADPPITGLTEIFAPPVKDPKAAVADYIGYSPRGSDIDRNGVVWVPFSSGHLASFDRRKCEGPLNGPAAADGQQCPEGWTLYQLPGPQFKSVKDPGSAEASYFTWVDQFDTFGLGTNTPFATGNESDALFALVNGKFVTLRVPYPMGFYAKNLDGRIDDPNGGWKGKGLWSTTGTRTPFHMEGGKGTQPKVVHFQLRPDPLAD